MQDLRDVLSSQGDDLTGWELIEARDVSADGRTITGRGSNAAGQEEAWLARLDLQQTVALGRNDLAVSKNWSTRTAEGDYSGYTDDRRF